MKHISYIYTMLAAVLLVGFTSCSDDDDYQPGKPAAEGNVGAYFASDNAADQVLTAENTSFTLTVSRSNTEEAVTVPINVVYSDTTAIRIPSSVSFEAGQSTAELTVNCDGLALKKQYGYGITIGDEAADHYKVQDGTATFQGTVVVSEWVKLHNVMFYFSQTDGMPTTYSDLYQLDGVNKFYLSNFLGSDTDLYFSVSGTSFTLDDLNTSEGELVPYAGAEVEDYGTYKENYLLTSASDGYSWSTGGVDFSYLMWYGGYDYNTYSWIDFHEGSAGYIYMSAYVSSSVTTGYANLYGVWND